MKEDALVYMVGGLSRLRRRRPGATVHEDAPAGMVCGVAVLAQAAAWRDGV